MEPRKIGETPPSAHPALKEVSKEELKKQLLRLAEKHRKDRIDLSAQAKKISQWVEIIKKLPQVREDKIREVEKKLSTKEYESREVLEETLKKIIEEIL